MRTDLFGGKGAVQIWDLLGATKIEPFAAVLECELEPGGNVGTHVQQEFPEIVICLAGRGRAEVNGEPTELAPGVLVPLPHGSTLALSNHDDENALRYLIIKARAL